MWSNVGIEVEFDGIRCRILQQNIIEIPDREKMNYYKVQSYGSIGDRTIFCAFRATIKSGKLQYGYYQRSHVALAEGRCAKASSIPSECDYAARAFISNGKVTVQTLQILR